LVHRLERLFAALEDSDLVASVEVAFVDPPEELRERGVVNSRRESLRKTRNGFRPETARKAPAGARPQNRCQPPHETLTRFN
jgi:hypothetical protein